jgi:hypothetical protein
MDQPLVLGTILEAHAGARKKERRNQTKEQSSQALADRPARRGGLSARATRTVRQCTADCLHRYGGPSGLGRGLSVKTNRTTKSEPRKMDRPRGARGLSARHPRTIRPAHADHQKPRPTKTQKHNGLKAKPSKNAKNTRRTLPARTVCHHLADCPPYMDRPRNSPTSRVNSPNSSPDLPNGRSCRDKSLGT